MGYSKSGEYTLLYSYNAVVGVVNKFGKAVLSDGRWSQTTSCHQAHFRSLFDYSEIPADLFMILATQLRGLESARRYVPNYKWTRETIGIPPIKEKKEKPAPQTKW